MAMSVGLPDDKLVRRAADVFVLELCAQAGVEVPVGYFRSVAGKVAHPSLASVYPAVAVHTRGLCLPLAMVDAAGKPLRYLRLWSADTRLVKARAAVEWLAAAFRSARLSAPRVLARGPSPVVSISADASGDVGWGCQFGGAAYWGRWTSEQLPLSICFKELWPSCLMLQQYGEAWRGSIVHVMKDNMSNAYSINSLTAEGDAARLVAVIADLCDRFDVVLLASWLPREFNVTCDALSKATSIDDARLVCSGCLDLSGASVSWRTSGDGGLAASSTATDGGSAPGC